jgi:hypothetical protein
MAAVNSTDMQNLSAYHSRGYDGPGRIKAIRHLDRMNWAIRVFVVISIVALVATIVLLGLAQAEYVEPQFPLYAFTACVGPFFVMAAIHCCQQAVASKHNIDLESYFRSKQRVPPKEEENKKTTK